MGHKITTLFANIFRKAYFCIVFFIQSRRKMGYLSV